MSKSDSSASRDDWARRGAAWERTSKESETSSTDYNDALIEGV